MHATTRHLSFKGLALSPPVLYCVMDYVIIVWSLFFSNLIKVDSLLTLIKVDFLLTLTKVDTQFRIYVSLSTLLTHPFFLA
jgi:hypothetical protein